MKTRNRPTYDELLATIRQQSEQLDKQASRIAELQKQVETLQLQLEQARRSGKRQAAPFSKGQPTDNPKTPGRKAGKDHGTHAHRPPPPVERIQETHTAQLPDTCPHCGECHTVEKSGTAEQFQTDILIQPVTRQFKICIGSCNKCGGRVQGRHPLQTSDAIGAAASQIGPVATAATVLLNKEMGLSHGKVSKIFQSLFGITLTRGGACRAMRRAAARLKAAHDELVNELPKQPMIVPDETGWRVGGRPAWLHAFATPAMTLYRIVSGRGADALADIIGKNYAGTLCHDGWRPYETFTTANHQTCLGHLIRRCREMLETAVGGAVRFPRQVKHVLQDALALRDMDVAGKVPTGDYQTALSKLIERMTKLLERTRINPANERLARHLARNQNSLFTFLSQRAADGSRIDATNWRAEQAIRPAVVNRKVFGGNRTWLGAADQASLTSILRTCYQRGIDSIRFMTDTLHANNHTNKPKLILNC